VLAVKEKLMQLPKYKPEQWVVYTVDGGQSHYFGKIVSGSYYADHGKTEQAWHYNVEIRAGSGPVYQLVDENAIAATFGKEWLPVS